MMRVLFSNGDLTDFGLFLAGELVVAAILISLILAGAQ